MSPYDLETFVKGEGFVRCHDRDVLHERLRDDLAVEGIGVMCRQIEQPEDIQTRGKLTFAKSDVMAGVGDLRLRVLPYAPEQVDRHGLAVFDCLDQLGQRILGLGHTHLHLDDYSYN